MVTLLLQATKKITESGKVVYETENDFSWFDFTGIFLGVILPVLIWAFAIYIIYRFLSILRKIHGSLEDINDSLKEKKAKD